MNFLSHEAGDLAESGGEASPDVLMANCVGLSWSSSSSCLGGVECLSSHPSADGEEQHAPDKYREHVAADDTADFVCQTAPVSSCVEGGGRAVFRRGCGIAVVVQKVVWRSRYA